MRRLRQLGAVLLATVLGTALLLATVPRVVPADSGIATIDAALNDLRAGVATLQARNRGDITYWGAVGDGVTDDTAAIQAAVNAQGLGGEVFIPCGGTRKFKITGPITIPSAFMTIRGCATGGVPLAGTGGSLIYTNTPSIDLFRTAHRAGGCTHDLSCEDTLTFKDFAIALDDSANNVTAINLTNSNNSQVDHVFIRGTTNITGSIGVLSSGILESNALRGGIDNRILKSFFYSLPKGVVVQVSANANVIAESRFWGSSANTIEHVDVRGICTGGTCSCASGTGSPPCVSCDADAVADGNGDCGACTGTCSSNVTGVVFNLKAYGNDIEDPAAGTDVFDRGKASVWSGNYSEMPSSGGQVAFDLYGLDTIVRDNYISLSTADSGIRINSTFVTRAVIEGNTCRGASNGTCINEASASASSTIGRNNYETVGTQVGFASSSTMVWADPAITVANSTGLNPLTVGNQPGNGSRVYCPTCTAGACGTGGNGAWANRENGAWVCVN